MSNYSVPGLPLLPIPQDVPVPADYWREGAMLPAMSTTVRWQRLNTYRDLYDGDWSEFGLRDLEVVDNYFASIPNFWADLMLAYPPTLQPEDEGLQADLKTALHEAVVDYFRYGVALLYAYRKDGEARIESIDPRLWYPMPNGEGDVLLRFVESRFVDVAVLPVEGDQVSMRFHVAEATVTNSMGVIDSSVLWPARIAPFACSLGEMVERVVTPRAEGTEGRNVFPIPRRPSYGDWGSSIYPEIASMVFGFSRRASDISVVNSEHTFPILTQQGDPISADPKVGLLDDRVTEGEQSEQADRRFRHNRRQGQKITMPEGVGLEYVVWDAALPAQFEEMDRIQQSIFRMSDTPQTLFGINTEQTPNTPSGEALRRSYIPTYLKSRQLQVVLLAAVNGALAALGIEGTEVEWPEPLEQIDNDTKGAMPAALGGNSEGAVDGDEEGGEEDAEMEMRDEPDEGGA